MRQLLFQGAESRIYLEELFGKKMLIKERFKKEYRVSDLDNHLTRERMKAECRNNVRCKQAGIKTPAIYFVDVNERLVFMEYFENSVTVKSFIQDVEKGLSASNSETIRTGLEKKLEDVAVLIGETIGKMHKFNIVHGDLTTSNFLLATRPEDDGVGDLILIDFGLSQSEGSDEDKAVDLYVLERAIVSTHGCTEKLFTTILRRYRSVLGVKSADVLNKFAEVRARGRKRTMVG